MELAEYSIGGLTLRPGRELRNGAAPVELGSRTLTLLSALAEADGAVLTKDELFAGVWGTPIVEENTLHAQISAARKALGHEAGRLVTVHGRGYRLVLDRGASPEPGAAADPASIAVLPFENLSGNRDHAYLAEGLAEELITTLARIPGLKVPARVSSFAYRGLAADVRTIAGELGVATVLEGSVRAGDGRLRVTAQLIDAASGFHLWAQGFDRTMTDLLTLQDDLAEAIAAALRQELGPRLRETHSAEAMRLVLQARAASRSFRLEGLHEAVRLARAALELDPDFAKAWESLAGTTYVMAGWGFDRGAESFADARKFAQKAMELDPALGGPHAIVGGIEAISGRFVEAAELLERALDLAPHDAVVAEHATLTVYLPTGLMGQATKLADASVAASPARALGHLVRASCAVSVGNAVQGRRHMKHGFKLGQITSRWLVEFLQSEVALAGGDHSGAAEAMVRLAERELAVPDAAGAVQAVYAALAGNGDRPAASDRVAAVVDAAHAKGTLWAHAGTLGLTLNWQVRLGRLDPAFAAAERLIERWRETGMLPIASISAFWHPDMAPFRRDPRFQVLVRELDLFRFWDRYGAPDGHRIVGGKLELV